ncbi:MAG: LD-carboxypeptidase [Bacteroidetes bacterium]|nr:LD-carboxypeptidase [Bacteroidota bacterium]
MIHPPYLKQGSTIGITCPSSYIPMERIQYATSVLESKGYKILLGKTCGTQFNYFAGTDEERTADLQSMLDNPNVDAILMGRGGYGMGRVIDKLDFTAFQNKPKWVCGFSDIIILQNHIQANFNMQVLHSPMCNAYKEEHLNSAHLQSFFDAISGQPLRYEFPESPYNRTGNAEGIITGGNLAILAHVTGSNSEVDTTDKILFIEDIGEVLYNIDRLMINLKRAGKLDKLKALVVGGLTDLTDTDRPFGKTVEDIILDNVKEYDYPVCFNFPVGHIDINYTVRLGAQHGLSVTSEKSVLELKQ